MTRGRRIALIVASSIAGLLLLLFVAVIVILQTAWFQNFAKNEIAAALNDAVGGRTEIGSFSLSLRDLSIHLRRIVLHGTEPSDVAPLLSVDAIDLEIGLFSGYKGLVNLKDLRIEHPAANVIVFANGTTNIPQPKTTKPPSNTSGLQTVVDLAVKRFALTNGLLQFAQQSVPLSVSGRNLRVLLNYDTRSPAYDGRLTLDPVYAKSGAGAAVTAHLDLPVRLEGDAISIAGGRLTTAESRFTIAARMDHLSAPVINAKASMHLSLPEVMAVANIKPPASARDLPSAADLEASVRSDDQHIEVQTARLTVGESSIQAAGFLKGGAGGNGLHYTARLVLDQLAKFAATAAKPSGAVLLSGDASMTDGSHYQTAGEIHTTDVRVQTDPKAAPLGPLRLAAQYRVDPHEVRVNDLRFSAFSGELVANAVLREFRNLSVRGELSGFDIRRVAADLGTKNVGYSGVLSGKLRAEGDLKAKGVAGYTANVALKITPAGGGMPVAGSIVAQYAGATESVSLDKSYVALPHSRLDLTGVLGNKLSARFVSRDFGDLLPALRMASPGKDVAMPVSLRPGGSANLTVEVDGPLKAPQIQGNLSVLRFAAQGRQFDRLSADVSASPGGAHISNGLLARDSLHADFDGGVGLKQWSTTPQSPVSLKASIQNADMADIMALAGQPPQQMTGALTASANVTGTVGTPAGGADLSIVNGSAYGEPFERIGASVHLADQLVTLQPLEIVAGDAHVTAEGTFRHPHDSYATGHVEASLNSSQIGLAQLKTLQQQHPGFSGTVQLSANAAADILNRAGAAEVAVRKVEANVTAQNLRDKQGSFGGLTLTAHTVNTNVNYTIDSDLARSNTTLRGSTNLAGADYPTTLDAQIKRLDIEKVLQLAGQQSVPAQGELSADAHLTGTVHNPSGNANLDLTRAKLYGEQIYEMKGRVDYAGNHVGIPAFEIAAPAGTIRLSGDLVHPVNDFNQGQLALHVESTDIALQQIAAVKNEQLGLMGTIHLLTDVNGRLDLQNKAMPLAIAKLNADLSAKALQMNGQALGDMGLTAQTQANHLTFRLDSNVAKASIQGQGTMGLGAGYPVSAKVYFSDIKYANIAPLLNAVGSGGSTRSTFDALVDGSMTVDGPVMNAEQLRGRLTLTQLAVVSTAPRDNQTPNKPVTLIQNQGPIVVALDHERVQIQSAHLAGRATDISASGNVNIAGTQNLNLTVNANTDLEILQNLSRDIYSAGAITAQLTVRGTFAQPLANGQIQLKNASLNIADSPNGISNANGLIVLNGTNASIRQLTGESGGGKITVNGFAGLTGKVVRYNLRANATRVRTRYAGASIVSTAALTLNGTTTNGLLSGQVTIDRIALNSQADTGSLLSSTAAPPVTPSAPSGPLAGLRLDIHVVTSSALTVQTSVTQNFSANADLNVRGTAENPAVLGRVNVTQGDLVFFGNEYTVNRGVINFYNPVKIEPILDVDLETTVQGVNVTLGVTGPIDNLKLNYRSDPPLRFDEIVSLLAAGKTPTSDPTIAAHQPTPPDQTLTQMGESAIVSQAVAAPIASRIQRVFGVNELKIDPTFTGGSSLPTARVTLQQQISPTIIFTYTTDLTSTTAQIIRVEWAFTPKFSAVATRDENGIVSIDFFLKKQKR